MGRQPESRLVARIQAGIRKRGGIPVKIHGGDNPFQSPVISDILCCYLGRFVAFEAKMPGEKPSRKQSIFLKQVEAAGGASAVVTSVAQAMAVLDRMVDWAWIAGFFEGEGHAGIGRP